MEEILLLRIGFNLEMRRLSRISRSNLHTSIVKSESEKLCPERWWWVRTTDICETKAYFQFWTKLPCICSEIRVCICQRVWPTYNAPQHWHLYLYTTCDLIAKEIRSLNGKKSHSLHVGRKTKRIDICG